MTLHLGNLAAWLIFLLATLGAILSPLDWQRGGYVAIVAVIGLYLGSIIGSTDE